MPNISAPEIMIIVVIALIVLGPKKLPDVARSAGKGMREFRAALSGESLEERDERKLDEKHEDEPAAAEEPREPREPREKAVAGGPPAETSA